MTSEDVLDKLATIITEKVDRRLTPDHIHLDSRLREDLGIDSLGLAELLYEIEEVFGTGLQSANLEGMRTVGDAVEAILSGLSVPLAS